MKALTVRQPWAWAIAHGGKTVENRSPGAIRWHTTLDLAIHAGSTWSRRGEHDPRIRGAFFDKYRAIGPLSDDVPVRPGMIVAVVDLIHIHPDSACCRPWGESEYHDASGARVRNVTHLVLEGIRPLENPVPWTRGRLGFWEVSPDLEDRIREQIPGNAA